MRRSVALALLLLGAGACKPRPAAPQKRPDQPTPAMQTFCMGTMRRTVACFQDDRFWDVMATAYFARNPTQNVAPDSKARWIGMRKDDVVGLRRDRLFEQNCQAMLERNKLPTDEEMRTVKAARSCPDFGAAMGYLLFTKGVFHETRANAPPAPPKP